MKVVAQFPERRNLRTMPVLLLGLVVVLVLWFFALYPLTPSTSLGWCAALLSGVVVFLWVWGCVELLVWLERPRAHRAVFKALGYPVALSLGLGIFAVAFFARDFLAHNFSYFFR